MHEAAEAEAEEISGVATGGCRPQGFERGFPPVGAEFGRKNLCAVIIQSLKGHPIDVELAQAMTPPRPRAKKPREFLVQIRVDAEERDLITQAAELDALPISNWGRMTLLAAARRTLRGAREQ
jgi:hypothetical protein